MFEGNQLDTKRKTYTLFAGVNGAGKTTLFSLPSIKQLNLGPRINTDEMINEIGASWKDTKAQISVGRKAVKMFNDCLNIKSNFHQETTLAGKSIIKSIVQAKENGFVVEMHYVGIRDVELALERIKKRVSEGGHGIPEEKVRKRYVESIKNLKLASKYCDKIYIYDNTTKLHMIAVINKGKIIDFRAEDDLFLKWIETIFE